MGLAFLQSNYLNFSKNPPMNELKIETKKFPPKLENDWTRFVPTRAQLFVKSALKYRSLTELRVGLREMGCSSLFI